MRIESALASTIGGQLNIGGASGAQMPSAAKTTGPSFEQVLSQSVSSGMATLQAGEAAAIQGLQGTLPAFKVVEAVMSAQRTLQSALAIRDKAVAAYQEISHMAI